METEREFSMWVASIERSDLGFTYVRLYRDAPRWVKNQAVNEFGKGTVFLPPRVQRPPSMSGKAGRGSGDSVAKGFRGVDRQAGHPA